ncbi:MAG: hypothetical protein CR992_00245 [Desulfobacterales bacterium]|nr:MAG: hypothetical protein CR992_00245 [Desulfobacterales bacterium]
MGTHNFKICVKIFPEIIGTMYEEPPIISSETVKRNKFCKKLRDFMGRFFPGLGIKYLYGVFCNENLREIVYP